MAVEMPLNVTKSLLIASPPESALMMCSCSQHSEGGEMQRGFGRRASRGSGWRAAALRGPHQPRAAAARQPSCGTGDTRATAPAAAARAALTLRAKQLAQPEK